MLLAVLAIGCSTASSLGAAGTAGTTGSDQPGSAGLAPAPAPRAAVARGAVETATRSPARRCPTDKAGFPKVTLRPRAGPAGTKIRIAASCFDRDWNKGYGMFLLRQVIKPRECELIGSGGFKLRVDGAGETRGYVIAPAGGHCFQHTYSRAATPGRYVVGFGCHACGGPTFTITRTPQPDSLEGPD